MTVDFALFLSPQGIALAHRQTEGHWALVGEVAFDSADLDAEMAGLKATATARGGASHPALLILPDEQILYTSFMAPVGDVLLVEARILEGLDGLTPYAVADLVHDWRPIEVDRVKVAVVAQETLDEAAAFAARHGFDGAGFVAMPPAEKFPGMPIFGKLQAEGIDGALGLTLGPDTWVDPASRPAPQEEAAEEDAAAAGDAPEIDADAGAEVTAPEAAPPAPETPPETTVAEAATDPVPAPEEPAVAPGSAPAEVAPQAGPPDTSGPTPEMAPQDGDAPSGLAAILDLTLDQPVAPVPQDPPSATGAEAAEAPPADGKSALPVDPAPAPVAARGKAARPSAEARSLTAEKPEASGPGGSKLNFRRAGAGDGAAPATPGTAAADTPRDEGGALGSFSARRGRAANPDPEASAGALVSARRPRLGFGAIPTEERGATLHPDAGAGPKPAEAAARPGSMLAAQLARVRDASKARPKADTAPARPAMTAERPVQAEAPVPPANRLPKPPSLRDMAGMFRRTQGPAATQDAPPEHKPDATPPQRANGADAAFAAGLLARKNATEPGPTLRTGLVLTLLLLVLLALIAIWSVLFLPDSPMARLFGGPDTPATEEVAAPEAEAVPEAAATAVDTAAVPVATPDAEALADGEIVEDIPIVPAPAVASAPPPPVAVLPDIDADLDLPPLPPLPQDALPSPEETERIYAEDGIWPRPPDRPFFSPFLLSDDIYIASIDPEVTAFDAVALADPGINIAETLRLVPPPPAFGAQLSRDARGLIAATPEGVLTPEGAFVVLGRPPVLSQPRPREVAPNLPEVAGLDVQDAILGSLQPRPRPGDLVESRERQVLGGLTVSELAGRRPTERPASAQETAGSASLFPQTGGVAPVETAAVTGGTERAIAISRLPSVRPANFAAIVAETRSAPEQVVAVAANAIAAPPSIPSNADVSRAATARNEIRLRDINLIGVTGTPSNRSALVRLPSGRFVRVSVGDRLDGGRVAAIGETTLQYVINGRNVTLEIPG